MDSISLTLKIEINCICISVVCFDYVKSKESSKCLLDQSFWSRQLSSFPSIHDNRMNSNVRIHMQKTYKKYRAYNRWFTISLFVAFIGKSIFFCCVNMRNVTNVDRFDINANEKCVKSFVAQLLVPFVLLCVCDVRFHTKKISLREKERSFHFRFNFDVSKRPDTLHII